MSNVWANIFPAIQCQLKGSAVTDISIPETPSPLARKLNLLMDAAETEGRKITYNDIRDAMAEAGTPLSRARWHYMRKGTGPEVKKVDLLRNLAVFFGVHPDYLLEGQADLPERVEAQMDLLATMRANKVRNFAARQLDGLSPETLLQIRNIIDEQLANKQPGVSSEIR